MDITGDEKLGWVIAEALGAEDNYRAAILPRGISRDVIGSAIGRSIELAAEKSGFPDDYALELTDRPMAQEEAGYRQVGWEQAVAYRAGKGRLFYFVDGNFTGGASLDNAIPAALVSTFPGEGGGDIRLQDVARAVIRLFKLETPDLFAAGNWSSFEEAVLEVIGFTAKLFEESGNQDLDQWQLGWWNHVKNFLDELDTYFEENRGALGTFDSGRVFSLAGLPRPQDSRVSYQYIDPKKYWSAFNEFWSDADKAKDSCAYLGMVYRDNKVIGSLKWDSYPVEISAQGHSVLAFITLGNLASGAQAQEFWTEIDELDFLRNSKKESDPLKSARVRLGAGGGGGGDCPEFPPKIFLVPLKESESGDKVWRGEFRIIIEDVAYIFDQPQSLDSSLLLPQVKSPVTAMVDQIEIEEGTSNLSISLGLQVSLDKEGATWPTKPVPFSFHVAGKSPGLSMLASNGKLNMKFLFPNPDCIPSLFIKAQEGRRRPKLVAFNGKSKGVPGVEEKLYEKVVQLAIPGTGDIYVFDPKALRPGETMDPGEEFASFRFNNTEANPHDVLPGLSYIEEQALANDDSIFGADEDLVVEGYINEILAKISVDNQPKNPPWLPLIAAAQGVSPRHHSDMVPEKDRRDLRGVLETKMTRAALDACAEKTPSAAYGLVQAILPIEGGARDTEFGEGPRAVWLGEKNDRPLFRAGYGPSESLCDSSQFREFWKALGEILKATDLLHDGVKDLAVLWISRCSLVDWDPVERDDHKPDDPGAKTNLYLIDDYLVKYRELVEFAEKNADPSADTDDRFWARYPFSAMVVESNANVLKGVLLSPLHPLRLAWLYSAERTAFESCSDIKGGMALLQVMEGWNFPWIGLAPAATGNIAILTATPTDDGETKLLSGWSYLVGDVSTVGESIMPPPIISGYSGPGAASTGLTAGGMISSIRDYIRVHPYISTLTLDMASGSKAPRSLEMDRGLLTEISSLAIDQKLYDVDLRGGVRIYDSMNRQNPPPDVEEEILRELRGEDGSPIPFSWQRYDPSNPPPVDLRFVEQEEVNVAYKSEGEMYGAITYFPVRRFMPFQIEPLGIPPEMHISGTIDPRDGTGWPAFKAALFAMESRDGKVQDLLVSTQEVRDPDSKATWRVTGNIQTSPSLISKQAAAMGDMLWEWRPGFLPKKKASVEMAAFGIRPYSTIAKIPVAFEKAVAGALENHHLDSKKLFKGLGERGVGLASLLAMGGHHVYGALGFYLGYELIDQLEVPDGAHRCVVPLDAVDLVFRAICSEDLIEETKRADLLVIDIFDGGERVNFVPIEIRCSLSQENTFPGIGRREVIRKLRQLSASRSLIKGALGLLREGDGDERRNSLEKAAIATIIECGLSLTPQISGNLDNSDIGKILSNITSSTRVDLTTRKGLLFWFQRGPEAQVSWSGDEPERGTGCLFVNADNTPLVGEDAGTGWKEAIDDVSSWLFEFDAGTGSQGGADASTGPGHDGGMDSKVGEPEGVSPVEPPAAGADSPPADEDEAVAGDEAEPASGVEEDTPGGEDGVVASGDEQVVVGGETEAGPGDGEDAAPRAGDKGADSPPGAALSAKELMRRARLKALSIRGDSMPMPIGLVEKTEPGDEAVLPADLVAQDATPGDGAGYDRPRVDIGTDPRGKRVIWDPLIEGQGLTNPHWLILGTSGTGKTQTIKAIVGELSQQGVIPVILDFNDDYFVEDYCTNIGADMVHVLATGLPINPLEPAPDTTPNKKGEALVINQVYALADNLQKVFGLGDQQNNYLKNALKAVYEKAGIGTEWVKIADTPFPKFLSLQEHLENPSWTQRKDERVINRLQSLFDLNVFRSDEEGSFNDLMKTPSVIRLTDLPGNKTKEAVAELFLMSFYNFMLGEGHSKKLKYLVVIDEAHKIADLKAMDTLIRESRKYGVGVVVSSQQTGDFQESFFANAGTLLSLGLQARGDIQLVSQFIAGTGSKKASEVASELRNLDPFHGLLYNDHYKDPYVKVRVKPYFERDIAKGE